MVWQEVTALSSISIAYLYTNFSVFTQITENITLLIVLQFTTNILSAKETHQKEEDPLKLI